MQRKDMTEKILYGSLWKSILFVALPLMLNNLIQTLYNLADALWVGRLGPEEFAATSFVWPVLFLFISVGIGVSMAGTSILSQLIGASKYKDASEFASLIYRLALGFALLIAALGYFVTPSLIHWMGARGHFARLSADYLQILFLGMPFQFLAFATNAVFQAQGITMLTTTLSAVSAGLNMVLNPFLPAFKPQRQFSPFLHKKRSSDGGSNRRISK
jgi:Na+-driven multidrug efflux pump